MQWTPPPMAMHMPNRVMSPPQAHSADSAALWDKVFQSHEASTILSAPLMEEAAGTSTQESVQIRHDADELARTAGELIETVKDEQNPKFKNSQFLQLMRGLRDGDIVVDGNDMVQRSEASSEALLSESKGKGKERVCCEWILVSDLS